jgi:beta-lactamase class A
MSIEQKISEVDAAFEGVISLAAKDLKTGKSVTYHAARKCPTASVIKLPILVHTVLLAQEGLLSLEETVTLANVDKVQGSGILTQLSEGLTITLRDACTLMIALSDNTATNLIIDRVGIAPINERMKFLGCPNTMLFRKVFSSDPAISPANRKYGLGVTTPNDMLKLLSAIHGCKIGDAETCGLLRGFLAKQHYRDGIPRLLEAGHKFEGKSGAVDAVRNDVGFVTVREGHDIALAIFCQKIPKPLWTADNPGLLAIARLSKILVDYFYTAD